MLNQDLLEMIYLTVGWFALLPLLNIAAIVSAYRLPRGVARWMLLIAGTGTLVFAALCLMTHLRVELSAFFGLINVISALAVWFVARAIRKRASAAASHTRTLG